MSLFIQLSEDLVPAGYKIVSYDFGINENHRFEASLKSPKQKEKRSCLTKSRRFLPMPGIILYFSVSVISA